MIRILQATFAIGAAAALTICPLCKPGAAARPVSASVAATRAATVTPHTVTLHITGMTCGGCVYGTKKVLTKLDGVTSADVSYEKGEAVIAYDDEKVTVEQMIKAIGTLGYKATVATGEAR